MDGRRATPQSVGFENWLDTEIQLVELSKVRHDTSILRTIRKDLNLSVDSFVLDYRLSTGLDKVKKEDVGFRLSRYILTKDRSGGVNIEYDIQGFITNPQVRYIDAARYQLPNRNGEVKYFVSVLEIEQAKSISPVAEKPENDKALTNQSVNDSNWATILLPYKDESYRIVPWETASELVRRSGVSYVETTWVRTEVATSRSVGTHKVQSRKMIAGYSNRDVFHLLVVSQIE